MTDAQLVDMFELVKWEVKRLGWSIKPRPEPASIPFASLPVERVFRVVDAKGEHVFATQSLVELRAILTGFCLAQQRWLTPTVASAADASKLIHTPNDVVSEAYIADLGFVMQAEAEQRRLNEPKENAREPKVLPV